MSDISITRYGRKFTQTLNQKTYIYVYVSQHDAGTSAANIMADARLPVIGSTLDEDITCFVTNRQLDMSDGAINATITITYSNTFGSGGSQPVAASAIATFAWGSSKEQVEITRFVEIGGGGDVIRNAANDTVTGLKGYDRFTTLKVVKIYDTLSLSPLVLKPGQINSDTFTVAGVTLAAGEAMFDGFSATEIVGTSGNQVQAEFNFTLHATKTVKGSPRSYWNMPIANAGDSELDDDGNLVKIVDATGSTITAFLDAAGKAILPPPAVEDVIYLTGNLVASFSFSSTFDFVS